MLSASDRSLGERRRFPAALTLLIIGAGGALIAFVLHRILDGVLGHGLVGAIAGFLFGVALGLFSVREARDRIFFAAAFGAICALFAWAAVSVGVQ